MRERAVGHMLSTSQLSVAHWRAAATQTFTVCATATVFLSSQKQKEGLKYNSCNKHSECACAENSLTAVILPPESNLSERPSRI